MDLRRQQQLDLNDRERRVGEEVGLGRRNF